ncbi:MAG: hypothetical protein FWE74_09645 [Oscillospiraceae bacterium]|nr:hypothetical protein [Oscillospiraceae bacterium]
MPKGHDEKMIKVSQDYLDKSLAPGRIVKCRIYAGEDIYTDKDILSFEFNDVVHPDDMSFGTTCANRFQFELWSRNNIPLSSVIRPFIRFAEPEDAGINDTQILENLEECTLGEFYITRRYRKRERYSVTCYDKMYRLDSRYNPTITFPCKAVDLLQDIAWHNSFRFGFTPEPDIIEYVPRTATCREVIGYLAGLNGAFAKFDRHGVLQLRKLALCDFVLTRNQYTELSVKADVNEVRQIEFIAEGETFSEGKGTKISTYRQHNPLACREAARRVFDMWNGFTYHGITVKMRGLPYLESGDAILIQDDFENTYYFALISDYTLIYDGGLTGRLVSKAKNPIDDYDEPMNQQRMIEGLSENLRVRYTNYVNEDNIRVETEPEGIASINFNLESRTFAVFNAQFTITADEDCVLVMDYRINNAKVGHSPRTMLRASEPVNVCLYNCFRIVRPGRNTLTLTAKTTSSGAWINKGELIASVSGQYMLGDSGLQRPEINIVQSISKQEINSINITIRKISEQADSPKIIYPHREQCSGNFEFLSLSSVKPVLRNFTARILMDSMFIEAKRISPHHILLIFSNSVSKTGNTVNLDAFNVSYGINKLIIESAEIIGSEITLATEDLTDYNEVVIKYDKSYGNLISAATGNPLQSFNFILNLENIEG